MIEVEEEIALSPSGAAPVYPKYNVIVSVGMRANICGYALHRPSEESGVGELFYISLVGPREAVRAIAAALIGGKTAILYFEECTYTESGEEKREGGDRVMVRLADLPGGFRLFSAPLLESGSAVINHVIIPQMALGRPGAGRSDTKSQERIEAVRGSGQFVMLGLPSGPRGAHPEDNRLLPLIYLDRLNDLSHIPLHPRWSTWLWDHARSTGQARLLESAGLCFVYHCIPDEKIIAASLKDAISSGALPSLSTEVIHPSAALEIDAA